MVRAAVTFSYQALAVVKVQHIWNSFLWEHYAQNAKVLPVIDGFSVRAILWSFALFGCQRVTYQFGILNKSCSLLMLWLCFFVYTLPYFSASLPRRSEV